jgi:hypothetical protein
MGMWWKKRGIANEFQFFFDPNGGNVEIKPTNKIQSFFSERDPFNARKTSLFISITSLIRMEWTKAFLVRMDLSSMAQFSFIF